MGKIQASKRAEVSICPIISGQFRLTLNFRIHILFIIYKFLYFIYNFIVFTVM